MASLYQRMAVRLRLVKEICLRTSRRSLLLSSNAANIASCFENERFLLGFAKPSVTQMRFYEIHDVYGPSKFAPRPGRPDYEERMWKALNTFERFPKEKKLTLESHFANDLGLDSLDHVELIVALETEFNCEIPDDVAEKLMTPKEMLDYLCEKDKVPEKRGEYGEISFKF